MTTLEQALVNESWERGVIKWKLHDGQREVYDQIDKSTDKLFVLNCSRQWGKSFFMALRAIETALKNPNAKIWYVTGTMSDLELFIIPKFEQILEDCPAHLKPTFKYNKEFEFKNGATIILTGLDKNPKKIRGNTLDLVLMDEVAFMSELEKLYKDEINPTTLHRPKAKIVMGSTPPKTPAHDFPEFCTKAKKGNPVIGKSGVILQGNYAEANIYTNPLLVESQIQQAKDDCDGEHTTAFKREYLCQFVTEEKEIIIQEWPNVKNDCIKPIFQDKAYKFHQKYIAMDVGVKDFTAILYGHFNYGQQKLYIEDEDTLVGFKVTPANIASHIKKKRTELWGETTPYRGVSDIDKLLINALNAEHKEVFHAVSKDTLINMVTRVRRMIKNKEIVIAPKCIMLLGCMDNAIWDAGSMKTQEFAKFARSKTFGHFDHLAALIYLVMKLDRNTDPVPAHFGVDLSNKLVIDQHKYNGVKNSVKIFQKLITPKYKDDK